MSTAPSPTKRARSATMEEMNDDAELLNALRTCQSLITRRLVPAANEGSLVDALQTHPIPTQWANNLKQVFFTKAQIDQRIDEIAAEINAEYKGREVIVVGLLKGAICFMSDLVRKLTVPYIMDFMQVSSYKGTNSSGTIELKKDMAEDPTNKHVIIVEDIVDTGNTLAWLRTYLKTKNAASVKIACLLDKKEGRRSENSGVAVDYVGFNCPNKFVVGYGLDFNQHYRGLPFIAVLKEEAYAKPSSS